MPRSRAKLSRDDERRQGKALASCLECRLSKTKCEGAHGSSSVADRGSSCKRCSQYGFQCRIPLSGKRGPKPKSKLTNGQTTIKEAVDDAETRIFELDDVEQRRTIWTRIQSRSRMQGSSYTFVSQGELDLGNAEVVGEVQVPSNPQASTRSPTLRQLLRRVDDRSCFGGCRQVSHLPFVVSSDEVFELPCNDRERQLLVTYFDTHLLPWICCFGSATNILSSAHAPLAFGKAFLLTAIMHVAAGFQVGNITELTRQDLSRRCRQLSVTAFATLQDDVDTLMAFDLLTIWKSPDDDFSEHYAVYADHISASLARSRRKDAVAIRAQLFHYIQRSVIFLHVNEGGVEESRSSDWTPMDWIDVLLHGPENDSLPMDWFVCADVESIVMQRKVKSLVTSISNDQGGMASSGALLGHLLTLDVDLKNWERRWKRRASTHPGFADQALQILGSSVRMQISSIVFKQTLHQVVGKDGADATHHQRKTDDLLNMSYVMCSESAAKLLYVAQNVDRQALMHLTDSITILINHAALIAVYLSAIAAPIMDSGRALNAQLLQAFSSHSVKDVMQSLASTRDSLRNSAALVTGETVCKLSGEHLDSLIATCQDDATGTSFQDLTTFTDGFNDLNWLNSILFDFDPTQYTWETGYHIAR